MRIAPAILAACLVASCATQPPAAHIPEVPVFLYGFLHGFIAPFSLVASIFYDVRIYAFPNNGGWYDFGYILGIATLCGGGSRVA